MKLALLEAEFANIDLQTIATKSMPDLRVWREQCLTVEAQLSLLRRLVHGQIDILEAKSIEDGAEVSTVLRTVPTVLADGESIARHQVARGVEVQEPDSDLSDELLRVADGNDLGSLLNLPLDERLKVVGQLWAFESRVSALRRTMQDIVDGIQSEVGSRYRNGDVTFPVGALS